MSHPPRRSPLTADPEPDRSRLGARRSSVWASAWAWGWPASPSPSRSWPSRSSSWRRTEPGSGLDRDLVRTGLFEVALPFGVRGRDRGGDRSSGIWYARGGRLPPTARRSTSEPPSIAVARMATPALPPVHPRPPRRRVVQGRRHRRQVPRRGRAHRAGVLHRRRGGRHPQPGHGPRARQGRHRRGAPGRARPGRRDHRLRRGRAARLPRLRHARQRGQRNPDAFANAPFDEAVGRLVAIIRRTRPQVDPHLRRRAGRLPPPRPPPGPRHHPAGRRSRR